MRGDDDQIVDDGKFIVIWKRKTTAGHRDIDIASLLALKVFRRRTLFPLGLIARKPITSLKPKNSTVLS